MGQYYNVNRACYVTWPLLSAYTKARRKKLHIANKFHAPIGIKEPFYGPIMWFENYVFPEVQDKQVIVAYIPEYFIEHWRRIHPDYHRVANIDSA